MVVALLVYPCLYRLDISKGEALDAAIWLLVALLIGSLIYSIHRAIPYPIFVRLVNCLLKVGGNTICERLFSPKSFDEVLDFREANKKRGDWLKGWADQTHFLWCTGYAVLLGGNLPSWWYEPSKYYRSMLALGLLLLMAAIWDDVRHLLYQRHVVRKWKNAKAS